MDLTILGRLLPAVLVGVAVAWWAVRSEARPGEVLDEALRGLVIGLVAGRVAWLALGGWSVVRYAPTTAVLVRAGVETWVGLAVAAVLGARRLPQAPWLTRAIGPGLLAGLAAWHVGCGVEGLCAGQPSAWGVHLPGYLSRVFPTAYVEAGVAAALAGVAWRWRFRPSVVAGAVAAYALARAGLGLTRAPLVDAPTRDQVGALVSAVGLAVVAWAWRSRPSLRPRVVRSGDVELQVFESGPRDRPAVLLGHGVGSSSRFLREAFEGPVLGAGWRLVTYDLRGHGASTPLPDAADHAIERHASDVAAIVAVTSDVRVVGGVSLGGHAAAAWLVGGGSADGLALVLPGWVGEATPGVGPHAAVAEEVAAHGVSGMVERLRADEALPDWLRATLTRDLGSGDPTSVGAALTALDGGVGLDVDALVGIGVARAVVGWPDDPGHPLVVAEAAVGAGGRAHLEVTSLAAVGVDRAELGAALVRALDALAIRPA